MIALPRNHHASCSAGVAEQDTLMHNSCHPDQNYHIFVKFLVNYMLTGLNSQNGLFKPNLIFKMSLSKISYLFYKLVFLNLKLKA